MLCLNVGVVDFSAGASAGQDFAEAFVEGLEVEALERVNGFSGHGSHTAFKRIGLQVS